MYNFAPIAVSIRHLNLEIRERVSIVERHHLTHGSSIKTTRGGRSRNKERAMAARSGQITVSTAGTAVQGPNVVGKVFQFAPHPSNTGDVVYVGNDGAGDVASTNGYPLIEGQSAGVQASEPNQTLNLNQLWFDVATSGDKVCWLRVQ